jgi:ADP-dependent NAD(P)H-hydrate dehydratase
MGDLVEVTEVPRLPRRARDAHKGSFGRVLVVGGSRGMIGAPALAANAALRGGAGLVTIATPERIQLAVAGLCPCATSLPLTCAAEGQPAPQAVGEMHSAAATADVLAVGPGLSVGAGQGALVRWALEQDKPLVLDADGLNNLTRIDDWPHLRKCPMVLTPHPGEFSRLTGQTIGAVQVDRCAVAAALAGEWADGCSEAPLVCVLKGAGTVVTDGRRVFVNPTGNPGMATGGSGDVLTGLIAALIGQGLQPFEASCLGAYVHGLAGDAAAGKLGEVSLIATDLLDALPAAMQEVVG